MLIEGLLVLAALAVGVLVAGTLSGAQVAAPIEPAEPEQPPAEGKPPPFVPFIMIDSSGESTAAAAELYRQYYDREGA